MSYRIYQLSARAMTCYARETDGVYTYHLSRAATEWCRVFGARHEQDSSALFFQTMCVVRGNDFTEEHNALIEDLADVIFYMDFSGIFDRNTTPKHLERQRKAEDMFRPEGVWLDFGNGEQRYLAFERSGSMSRQAQLSFLRADVYDAVRRRIQMDMTIRDCQLSKLYAYNGLMLSSGARVEGVDIDRPHRVIVVDNPTAAVGPVDVITVEDDGTDNSTRRYHRVERRATIDVTCLDGEGIISTRYARRIDKAFCGRHVHHSFQIRLPYVKGMLHELDIHDLFRYDDVRTITDIWGVEHNTKDVDVILTRSMFKGFGWLKDSGMTWEDYWAVFRKYRHALYITNVSKVEPEGLTELNYQFLNTVSLRADEFRPYDLPEGWDHSPAEDGRHWLTKLTELAYYKLRADRKGRADYFLRELDRFRLFDRDKSKEYHMAAALKKNPRLIAEPAYVKRLDDRAEQIVRQYAVGRLIVEGDNRFLSGNLLALLIPWLDPEDAKGRKDRRRREWIRTSCRIPDGTFYAPGAAYEHGAPCTLLRNPHIARNEELLLTWYDASRNRNMRDYYYRNLTDVVFVSDLMLSAARLGGADYDGDMVKTIADPIINACVRRNYRTSDGQEGQALSNEENLPLLMIPAAEPRIADADDWRARMETVKGTFSSRIGQICNAALDRSVIAYNENSDGEERRRCREETETLAILVGLEIDSAKSGVRPDLDEYLGRRDIQRTPFLRYKDLVERAEERRAWYEPTPAQRMKDYFDSVDWSEVDSNLERLPLLARQLKKRTPKIVDKPAEDSELFTFAQRPDWKERLDPTTLERVGELLRDYEAVLSRIRACRAPVRNLPRKQDIDRILYARGQENDWDADELYARLQDLDARHISRLRQAILEERWHLMDEGARERFLTTWLPGHADLFDLLSDFRFGGYRVLADLIMDLDDAAEAKERKQLFREQDSPAFTGMMEAYLARSGAQTYREAVAAYCRTLLDNFIEPVEAVAYVVALGRRDLLWDLLPDAVLPNLLEVRHGK